MHIDRNDINFVPLTEVIPLAHMIGTCSQSESANEAEEDGILPCDKVEGYAYNDSFHVHDHLLPASPSPVGEKEIPSTSRLIVSDVNEGDIDNQPGKRRRERLEVLREIEKVYMKVIGDENTLFMKEIRKKEDGVEVDFVDVGMIHEKERGLKLELGKVIRLAKVEDESHGRAEEAPAMQREREEEVIKRVLKEDKEVQFNRDEGEREIERNDEIERLREREVQLSRRLADRERHLEELKKG